MNHHRQNIGVSETETLAMLGHRTLIHLSTMLAVTVLDVLVIWTEKELMEWGAIKGGQKMTPLPTSVVKAILVSKSFATRDLDGSVTTYHRFNNPVMSV